MEKTSDSGAAGGVPCRASLREVNWTAGEAADRIQSDLRQAGEFLAKGALGAALDGYVEALGLALQLGPAPVEQVLAAALATAQVRDADILAALGPALVGLADQVRQAGALPDTAIMEAWATVAAEVGALIGQAGVALSIPVERRATMVDSMRRHAAMLDETTGELFGLGQWLDAVVAAQ